MIVERVRGIEPLYEAWEAAVLPLNYTRSRRGFYRDAGVRLACDNAAGRDMGFTATRTAAAAISLKLEPAQVLDKAVSFSGITTQGVQLSPHDMRVG